MGQNPPTGDPTRVLLAAPDTHQLTSVRHAPDKVSAEQRKLFELPKRRTGQRAEWLASWSAWRIGLSGLLAYIGIVLCASSIEYYLAAIGVPCVRSSHDQIVVAWGELVYFNFATILTIGYGDLSPVGIGARMLSIAEAVLGAAIFGVTLAALTAKFVAAPPNAIVFSRYAYYCSDTEQFLVIYMNTTVLRLFNVELASYFKLGGDWVVHPAVKSPLITRAVQTYFTDLVRHEELVGGLDERADVLRFGLTGQMGSTTVAAAIQYKPHEIVVLPNRKALTSYEGFWIPDLGSREFQEMFHYRPPDAPTLVEYVEALRLRTG